MTEANKKEMTEFFERFSKLNKAQKQTIKEQINHLSSYPSS